MLASEGRIESSCSTNHRSRKPVKLPIFDCFDLQKWSFIWLAYCLLD